MRWSHDTIFRGWTMMPTRLLSMYEGRRLVGVRRAVAVEHAHADLPQTVGVLDDLCRPDDGYAAQLVVGLARLDQAGDAGVAAQVEDLLGLGFAFHRQLAVEKAVPHADGVHAAVGQQRAHGQGATLVKKVVHLRRGHANQIALLLTVTQVGTAGAHDSTIVWTSR